MSELTKEWLQQTIADLEEERDSMPGAVNEDAAMALAAMKIALAALEAEPVSVFKIDHESSLIKHVKKVVSENNAPPAPVSAPAGYRLQPISEYDAMCAAMLQGADGNSPVIPDGWVVVPVDMAPEMMRAVQFNSELGAYAAANLTGAYSLFREFWDVAVTAAPQQEVKP